MASAIAAASRAARAAWARAWRRAARIRYRLLLINVIVAVVPVVGIAFAEMHEAQLLAALERDMIHQGELVRAIVRAARDGVPLEHHQRVLVTAARETRTRIRLLDAHGAVRADSHRGGPPEGAERAVPRLLRGEIADPRGRGAAAARDRDAPRDPGGARRALRLGDAAVGQPGRACICSRRCR